MHVVKIENRGPEGIRGYKQFRLTQAGSDDLHKRMVDNVPFAELLTGIKLEGDEPVGELVRDTNPVPVEPSPFDGPSESKERKTTPAK
jgi:hypothetical protein